MDLRRRQKRRDLPEAQLQFFLLVQPFLSFTLRQGEERRRLLRYERVRVDGIIIYHEKKNLIRIISIFVV